MAALQITSYLFTICVGGVALLRIFKDSFKNLSSIILNIMFGGALYAMINILGFPITLNILSGCIIAFLGVPGVVLLVILKIIFGIF